MRPVYQQAVYQPAPLLRVAAPASQRATARGYVLQAPAYAPQAPAQAPQLQPLAQPTYAPQAAPAAVAPAREGKRTVSTWIEAGPIAPAVVGPGTDFASMEDYFPPPLPMWGDPYASMLEFLERSGFLQQLPLDASGRLRVSVPFCAGFMECQMLLPMLARLFLGPGKTAGVSILGSDVEEFQGGNWAKKERYARRFPNMDLQLRRMDLGREPLPPCGLTIGVHPEATRDKIWEEIFANIVRSMQDGGLLVIATYFEIEFQAVQSYCAPLGVQFQVYENPYYKSHPVDRSPSLRFILVARCCKAAGRAP